MNLIHNPTFYLRYITFINNSKNFGLHHSTKQTYKYLPEFTHTNKTQYNFLDHNIQQTKQTILSTISYVAQNIPILICTAAGR